MDSVQFVPCQYRNSDVVIGNITEEDFCTYARRMTSSLMWRFTSIFTHAMYYMAFLVTRQGLFALLSPHCLWDFHLGWFSGFRQKYLFKEQEFKCQTLVVTHLVCYTFFGNSQNECFGGTNKKVSDGIKCPFL